MRENFKRICAALIAVYIIISGIPALPVSAAQSAVDQTAFDVSTYAAQPKIYSKEYNSGTRGVTCTTLDGTSASSYYTGQYTYDKLSVLSSGSLKTKLNTLMTSTHSYNSSYDDCHYEAHKTDCQNEDKSVLLIYTSFVSSQNGWGVWNREHVWPKSLGGFGTSGAGADLHHIRPSDNVVNSTRNNNKYGNAINGEKKYGSSGVGNALGGYYANGYFEPLDNVKGDVARICLYVHARYYSTHNECDDITNVFESVDVLLQWCALDPVDTWEMGRNEVVQDIQGNRNVFIDYPEYAWQLFGREVPDNMVTPSGNAGGNTENGGATENPEQTTEQTTGQPTEPPTEQTTEQTTQNPSETPTEDRKISVNVYYGEKIRFMFASNEKPTIYITDGDEDDYFNVEAFIEDGEQLVYEGRPVWISEGGVALQNIATRVTVQVGSYSMEYSVLEYLYTRLYVCDDVTEAQKDMYSKLIDCAKKLDVVLNQVEESRIGSEYLAIVTGGTLDGSDRSNLFAAGSKPFANVDKYFDVNNVLGWQVSINGGQPESYTTEELKALAISGHTEVTVIKKEIEEKDPQWVLVTDVSQLKVGAQIIIAASDSDFALSTNQKNNNRGQEAIIKNGNILQSHSDAVQIITLEAGTKTGTFAFKVDTGYLYAANSSNNYLRTQTTLDANGSWKITVDANGIAGVVAQGDNTRNIMRYNKSSSLFACYSSGQQDISIYVLTK